MRIWLVPFCELDNKRLVAQHHEWHAIENKIRGLGHRWKNWELKEYLSEFYILHGIAVQEMKIRGMAGHRTPPKYYVPGITEIEESDHYGPRRYPRPRAVLQEERFELLTRWGDGGFHGRETAAKQEWEEVFARWEVHGGCPHERPLIKVAGGQMCPTCKKVFPT